MSDVQRRLLQVRVAVLGEVPLHPQPETHRHDRDGCEDHASGDAAEEYDGQREQDLHRDAPPGVGLLEQRRRQRRGRRGASERELDVLRPPAAEAALDARDVTCEPKATKRTAVKASSGRLRGECDALFRIWSAEGYCKPQDMSKAELMALGGLGAAERIG